MYIWCCYICALCIYGAAIYVHYVYMVLLYMCTMYIWCCYICALCIYGAAIYVHYVYMLVLFIIVCTVNYLHAVHCTN